MRRTFTTKAWQARGVDSSALCDTEGEFGLQVTAYCCARLDASNHTIVCLIYIAPAAMTPPRCHRIIMQDMTPGCANPVFLLQMLSEEDVYGIRSIFWRVPLPFGR